MMTFNRHNITVIVLSVALTLKFYKENLSKVED